MRVQRKAIPGGAYSEDVSVCRYIFRPIEKKPSIICEKEAVTLLLPIDLQYSK